MYVMWIVSMITAVKNVSLIDSAKTKIYSFGN